MAVSPDGHELYFLGQHAHEFTRDPDNWDLWVSRLAGGTWAAAQVVPPPISTQARESYPVVVSDGSLYFASDRPGGHGRSDVYRAQRLPGGGFAEPANIGPPINTEFNEGDTFVAPDESYLLVASSRPGGFGQGDLYVSFRGKDGRWQPLVNVGDAINTDQTEFCPMVTPDGKYLFFSRRWGATWEETTAGDVFWVDVKLLESVQTLSVPPAPARPSADGASAGKFQRRGRHAPRHPSAEPAHSLRDVSRNRSGDRALQGGKVPCRQ